MSSASITNRSQLGEAEVSARPHNLGAVFMKYLTTTDHKVIGNMYFVTAFLFFLLGGVLALGIRAEHPSGSSLAQRPGAYGQARSPTGAPGLDAAPHPRPAQNRQQHHHRLYRHQD